MFGYVRPMDCELKVKDQTTYRAAYCGLCKVIKHRHGRFASLFLTYDCTFLSLLLLALKPDSPHCSKCHCLHRCNQSRKLSMDSTPAIEYAADVNVLLSYYKCRDDWQDEKRLSKRFCAAMLKPKVGRIKLAQSKLAAAIEKQMCELSQLEREGCTDSDKVADKFANLLCAIGDNAPSVTKGDRVALHWLMYNLGRWIYLIDAADDMDNDKNKGRYNPFILAGRSKEDTAYTLYQSLNEAKNALNVLNLARYGDILDNIITLGCVQKTRSVLKEKQDESL